MMTKFTANSVLTLNFRGDHDALLNQLNQFIGKYAFAYVPDGVNLTNYSLISHDVQKIEEKIEEKKPEGFLSDDEPI